MIWLPCRSISVRSVCWDTLVTNLLADQDDVDAAGLLLVDLEDLADVAVHAVGGDRAGVFEFQAVLVDPLARCAQVGNELLRTDDEDDVGGTQA